MTFTEHAFHYVDNKAGWKLELKQCRPPRKTNVRRNPVAMIPGYGMNSFIFGFHRLVWWPKCTPASSSSFMVSAAMVLPSFPSSFGWPPVASGRPPERSATLPRQPTRAAETEARNRAC